MPQLQVLPNEGDDEDKELAKVGQGKDAKHYHDPRVLSLTLVPRTSCGSGTKSWLEMDVMEEGEDGRLLALLAGSLEVLS